MTMNSMVQNQKIRTLLQKRIESGHGCFAAYLTLGYPDLETSIEAMVASAKQGVDIIEIGVPFSDPIADGPIIQYTGNYALQQGNKPYHAWKASTEIRKRTSALPIIMTYANIPFHYGYSKFAKKARESGICGLILPDLPLEYYPLELEMLEPIYLVSTLTKKERLRLLAEATNGFLYLISHLGITGEQQAYDTRLRSIIEESKKIDPSLPVLLGFGVHDEKSARNALDLGTDGIIVGSALLKTLGNNGDIGKLEELVHDINQGLLMSC